MLTLTGPHITPETTEPLLDHCNNIEGMTLLDLGPEHPLPLKPPQPVQLEPHHPLYLDYLLSIPPRPHRLPPSCLLLLASSRPIAVQGVKECMRTLIPQGFGAVVFVGGKRAGRGRV